MTISDKGYPTMTTLVRDLNMNALVNIPNTIISTHGHLTKTSDLFLLSQGVQVLAIYRLICPQSFNTMTKHLV